MKEQRKSDGIGDWAIFEELMTRAFPFLKDGLKLDRIMPDPAPVGKLVEEALNRSFKGAFTSGMASRPGRLHYEWFETHRSLIIRVRLPEDLYPDQLRTLVSKRKLRLEWPDGKRQDINLAKPVSPGRSRARHKHGILEIIMPKIREPERFVEL